MLIAIKTSLYRRQWKKKAIPLKQKSSQWFVSNSMHFMTITCTDWAPYGFLYILKEMSIYIIYGLYWILKRSVVHSPLRQGTLSWVYSFNTINVVCKRNRELNKTFSLGVENLSFAVITSKYHSLSQKWNGEPHKYYLSKLTNAHYSFKNEGYVLYVTSPN